MPAELSVAREHVVAVRAVRHEDGADLSVVPVPRCTAAGTAFACDRGDGHAGGDVGTAVGYELLGAVDDPLPVAKLGAGLGGTGIGARLRFGQAEGPELFSREQIRKPRLLLLLGAEVVDRRGAEADRCLERDADAGVRSRDLLDRQAQR